MGTYTIFFGGLNGSSIHRSRYNNPDNFLNEETLAKVREQSECLKMNKLELGYDKVYKMNTGDTIKAKTNIGQTKDLGIIILNFYGRVIRICTQ